MSEITERVVPAATVVIFRHAAAGGPPELLMLERSGSMRFAGGAAVFPGGKVDPADHLLAQLLLPAHDPDDAAGRIAAVRETLEEAGLAIAVRETVLPVHAAEARAMLHKIGDLAPVLEKFGWTLDLAAVQPFAHWCPNREGAFDTRFYMIDLGTGAVDVAADKTENRHLFWTSAANALTMDDAGEISLIFPTRRNLERLAQFATFAEAEAQVHAIPVRRIVPRRAEINGEVCQVIPEGLGYPVTAQSWATMQRG